MDKTIFFLIVCLLAVIATGVLTWIFWPKPEKIVGCTMEAKLCPDGTAVGRVPPDCEFALCSNGSQEENIITFAKYGIINSAQEIDPAFDMKIADLARKVPYTEWLAWNFETYNKDKIDLINNEGATTSIGTCREYLCATNKGFHEYPDTMATNEIQEVNYICNQLGLFKLLQESERDYLSHFSLKNEWKNLPIKDMVGIGQMGVVLKKESDFTNSIIKESDDMYIRGENPNITYGPTNQNIYSFTIYLLASGDFNNDGIEDKLLYMDSPTEFYKYQSGMLIIISRLEENSPIVMLPNIFSNDTVIDDLCTIME